MKGYNVMVKIVTFLKGKNKNDKFKKQFVSFTYVWKIDK